jgi:hypothetical protein
MLKKALLVGSALGFATILSMGVSNAAEDQAPQLQQKMERQGGDNDCIGNQDCGQKNRGERRMRKNNDNDAVQKNDDDNDGSTRKSRAQRDDDNDNKVDSNRESRREARNWKYDPQRHHRSRHKDSKFRFYLGGYYYDEPYWDSPSVVIQLGNGRVSCGEGRDIVDDSGFNRVRTVECSGRNYTYLGRRHGDTFRVTLNSRTGRIVSVREL